MPLDEFWHGDLRLFDVYQTAYRRDKSYTAWINGVFIFEAATKAIYNGNRTKKSDPVEKYADWKDPIETKSRNYITEEEREEEFRVLQAQQNAWLHNMLNKE